MSAPSADSPQSAALSPVGKAWKAVRGFFGNEVVSLVATRLALAIPLLIGVSLLTFVILHFTAGDFIVARLGERANRPEEVQKLREQLGLNAPFLVQYGRYIYRVVTQLDFGRAWSRPESVTDALRSRFPATLELALAALLIAVVLGVTAGILAARFHNTLLDYASMSTALLGLSIPVFWLGLMLAYFFSVKLGWLPLSARLPTPPPEFERITGMHVVDGLLLMRWDVVAGALRHLCLPALTVGTISAALIARMTRASMLEAASNDWARTAVAKGLSGPRVTYHVFRNAALPVVTVIGLQFGGLLGGAIVTETIFTWDGIGKYLVDSILTRDGNAVQGAVLAITASFILVNGAVDVLYVFLDPRVSHRGRKAA